MIVRFIPLYMKDNSLDLFYSHMAAPIWPSLYGRPHMAAPIWPSLCVGIWVTQIPTHRGVWNTSSHVILTADYIHSKYGRIL